MKFLHYFNENPDMVLNEEQMAVVMSLDNTVVSAGAGSGKTTVLSYRFLRLVMDGYAHSDEILTLTFTRKAALEMSERIYKRLAKASAELPEGELDRFAKSAISTLDSFCSEIVRAGCVRYGISRDFSIDETETLAERVARLSARFINDVDNAEEVRVLSSLYAPDSVQDGFFMAVAYAVVLPGVYDAEETSDFFLSEIKERMEAGLESLRELLVHLEGSVSDAAEADRRAYLEALESGAYLNMGRFNLRKRSHFEEDAKELIADYREILDSFLPLASLIESSSTGDLLQKAVEKFASLLQKDKRSSGMLSFADTAALAVDILKRNRDIRRYYNHRFKYIMIDEFQDNNSLQRDLLYLLSVGDDYTAAEIPKASDLVRGKLFFVGDEKQSIYRFRGADVSVFRALDAELGSACGTSLSLRRNYRSDSKLISFFNSLFERVLSSSGELYEARFEQTMPSPDATSEGRILISLFNRDVILDNGLSASENEAEYIGDLIVRMLTGDEFLIKGKLPMPSDIAILMRTGSGQLDIERALKNRDIPYQLTETHSLMLDAISSDFYSLLETLLYPDDLIAYESVLRGPFARISDEGLVRLMNGKSEELSEADRIKYQLFSSFYTELKERAFRFTLPELVDFIWVKGGYASFVTDTPRYEGYREHYEYLFSYAVSYDEAGLSLTDYVKFLRDNMASGGKLDETVVLHSRKEGVQIMTIHKSKGLEFPIVITAGMGNGSRGNEGRYVFTYKDHLVASSDRNILSILQADDAAKELAEMRRLLYVAATRAEQHMVFTGCYQLSASGEFNRRSTGPLLRLLLEGIGYDSETGSAELSGIDIEEIKARMDYFHGGRDSAPLKLLEKKYKDYEAPKFVHHSRRVSVTSIEVSPDEAEVGERLPSIAEDEIISRLSCHDGFGTLCHAVLETMIKGGDIEAVSCMLAESEEENNRLKAAAMALAEGFFKSPLYHRLEGHEMKSEYRFYTYLEDRDAALEGVMDLVVFMDKYNIVIDYKSDSVRYESAHKVQLTEYVRAAEALFCRPCYGTLYYLRCGGDGSFIDRDGKSKEL